MHQLIGKKKSLILYFFFLVALSTTTNKTLYKTENLFQIDNINITGIPLDNIEGLNDELYKTIEKNIFFLKKEVLKNSISEFNIVEKYSVKKIYPRELNINIKPTKFIAKISNKDDVLVGSNGKLISNKDFKKKLPSIFGKFNSNKFLELKIHLERSGFNFEDLKSNRLGYLMITSEAKGNNVDFVVRCFAPQAGINEDPVTGSAHCALTPLWANRLGKTDMISHQISERGGVLNVALKNSKVEIKGKI